MAIKWSYEQSLAINESGKTILVNAGAGSGKTAVLTERLLRKVKNGVSLKNLIVLTFTKLAASEMKERLRKVLIRESANDEKIKSELAYIDQANIQTFDAYTSELVKKYHYLLNIPSTVNIIDDSSFKMEMIRILDDIFDEYYINKDEKFLVFIDQFSVHSDNKIKDYIISLYKKIIDNDDLDFLDNYQSMYTEEYLSMIIKDYESIIKDRVELANQAYLKLEKYTSDPVLLTHYNKLGQFVEKMNSSTTYQEFMNTIPFGFPQKPTKFENEDEGKEYIKLYEQFKKVRDKARELLEFESTDEIIFNHKTTYNTVEVICIIIKKLHTRLEEYKRINNSYTFNDIALMAIKILEENDEVRNSIKYNTNEILIDEYQDTSDIQERLINLIENNNVYMVGDVKQSIYRFRHANPDLFINKYNYLKKEDSVGMVIDLSQNFRSRFEVLDAVNGIFEKIMSEKIGGVNYDDSHSLKYGFKTYDNNIQHKASDYKMKFLSYFDDDNSKEFSQSEIEATIIAQSIASKVGKQKVYDKDLECLRPSKYSDFAILTSSKDKFELYKKIFEYYSIPLFIYKEESFATNDEVYAINNLLKVIYSFVDEDFSKDYFKVSLIGLLRSFIIGHSDEKISELFIGDDSLKLRFKKVFPVLYEIIVSIANQIKSMTLTQTIDLIFEKFDIYMKMTCLNNIEGVEFRINYFKTLVKNFEALNYRLIDVIQYFNRLIEDDETFKVEVKLKANENLNAVKMMSIHASKGLEFPVCYFPELSKRFNTSDGEGNFNYNKKYKMLTPYIKDGFLDENILKILSKDENISAEISEKIRLLYVALTRPREEMILVGKSFNEENGYTNSVNDAIKKTFKSFYDIFNAINFYFNEYTEYINVKKIGLSKNYLNTKKSAKLKIKNKNHLEFSKNVSKKELVSKTHPSKTVIGIVAPSELELMELGTHFHKLLELTDFKNPNYEGYSEKEKTLIERFLSSELISKLDIIETYHELEYVNQDEKGIIDLVIETSDKLIVVDYKLSNIDDSSYVKQVSAYKNYLEKISNKEVLGYLYSIYQGKFKEV